MNMALLKLVSPIYLVTLAALALFLGLALASGWHLQDVQPIALVILLLGMAAGLFKDLIGFGCLGIAWLPFSRGFLNVELGIVTLDGYMAAVLVLSGACAIAIGLGKERYKVTYIDLIISFICVVYLCSTLLSTDQIESGYLAVHAIFLPVLTYFSIKTLSKDAESSTRLVQAFVLGTVLFSLFVIKDYLLTDVRVETFKVPAISIGTVLLSALVLLMTSDGFGRWAKITFGVLLLAALFATLTRVFILLAIITPGLYWMVCRGRGTLMLIAMLGISLVGTVMLASNGESFRPSATYDASAGNVTEGRLTNINAWKEALYSRSKDDSEGLQNFAANPVVGTGLHRGIFVTRHNIHVAWLEYGGLLGYLAYVGLFVLHFMRSRRNLIGNRQLAGGLVVIFAILTNGITNGFMHGYMPIIAFMVLGLNEGMVLNVAPRPAVSGAHRRTRNGQRPANLMR